MGMGYKNNGILRLQYDSGDYSLSGLLCDCMEWYGLIFGMWEVQIIGRYIFVIW